MGDDVGEAVPQERQRLGHATLAVPQNAKSLQKIGSRVPKHSKHVEHVAGHNCLNVPLEQSAFTHVLGS